MGKTATAKKEHGLKALMPLKFPNTRFQDAAHQADEPCCMLYPGWLTGKRLKKGMNIGKEFAETVSAELQKEFAATVAAKRTMPAMGKKEFAETVSAKRRSLSNQPC